MSDKENIRRIVDEVSKFYSDQGKLIEAGWAALKVQALPKDAGPVQIKEMRMVFFAGAQHLFGSMMSILEPDAEPTEKDMERMTLIHEELEIWKKTFIEEHMQ